MNKFADVMVTINEDTRNSEENVKAIRDVIDLKAKRVEV